MLRGNVGELTVAVVVGAAFTAVVAAFTDSFLTPLIGLVTGGGGVGGAFVVGGETFTYGAFVSQVITFLLPAAVVYSLVVLPMTRPAEGRRRGAEAGPAAPTEVELLAEVRDLLRAQQAGVPGGPPTR
ncbi:large conductance mechanosensitive channel [Geodermatophilus amargosae]|uniref:Large conductance mechanosensitive channel n=1 Tax=Geodermatophilus amargosae TaxID=1296565 RepID=A0A1I7A5U6_9ACTN|nr:large conductance mechanosensitive channel [Geodermatophilus amargosae]